MFLVPLDCEEQKTFNSLLQFCTKKKIMKVILTEVVSWPLIGSFIFQILERKMVRITLALKM